jgi:hypothetical protein
MKRLGAFWGGIWDLLFGSAFFMIPGFGPILVAGPLVAWLVGALEGAVVVGGLSAIGAALYSIGIPKDSVVKYETAIQAGKYVLVAHCTADEVPSAKKIIEDTEVIESDVHHTDLVKVLHSVSPQKDTERGVVQMIGDNNIEQFRGQK